MTGGRPPRLRARRSCRRVQLRRFGRIASREGNRIQQRAGDSRRSAVHAVSSPPRTAAVAVAGRRSSACTNLLLLCHASAVSPPCFSPCNRLFVCCTAGIAVGGARQYLGQGQMHSTREGAVRHRAAGRPHMRQFLEENECEARFLHDGKDSQGRAAVCKGEPNQPAPAAGGPRRWQRQAQEE